MNILLINHYAGSPDMGMEFRPYYFAREWVKMGHKVDIIAADYSHLRRKNPVVKRDFQEENIDGITYHWVRTNEYQGNGVKRAMTMAKVVSKLWLRSRWIVNEFEPDVVICSSTYPLDTFAGQRIRNVSKKKVRLVHEVHDMWPATLIEVGGMSKYNPFVVAMQIGENRAYRKSDKVVSLLPYAEEYMKQHGLKEGKFVCIPNGVLESDWENPKPLPNSHQKVLNEMRNNSKFIVGYFGGHALSNALDSLLDVAYRIKDQDVQFVLVGNGVEKPRLMRKAAELKLSNVTFLDPISKRAIPSLCDMLDCIYMCGHSSPLYRFGLCLNKMFDAMRAGKPTICEITTPKTYLEQYDCGIRIDSENTEGAVEAIIKIKTMEKKERELMGSNGIKAIKEYFDYNKLSCKFIEEVN